MKTILAVIFGIYISVSAWAAEGAGQPPAPGTSSKQDQLIDQLLSISGLKVSLQRLHVQLATGFMQATLRNGANTGEQQEMVKAMERALPQDAFVNRVSAALKKNYDERRYAHFMQLLSDPVAKRMADLEASESNPAEVQAFLAQVSKRPLSPERIKLIQRIDMASQASALLTKMTIASIETDALAAGDDCPEAIARIRKMISKRLPEIEKANRSSAQVMLAFTYRNVSDADLGAYLNVYEDEDGMWTQRIIVGAIDEQFKSSMELGAGALKKVVQAHKSKKTMFAPKCGESESPNKDEQVQSEQVKDEPAKEQHGAKAQSSKAAATNVKMAALEQNAAVPKPVHKSHRRAKREADLRACLGLATSAEIMACAEK